MQNVWLDELQAGIKICRINTNNPTSGMQMYKDRKLRGTKKPLDKGEGGE